MEISLRKAERFADKDCPECGGTGWVLVGIQPDDRMESYCICASQNMAEYEAEMREE